MPPSWGTQRMQEEKRMGNFAVSLKRLVEKVSLEVTYAPCELDKISVEIAEVNRPGLFLTGYYDYFDKLRLHPRAKSL